MDMKHEFFIGHVDDIKQETIEYEESKIEQHSDLLIKIDYIKEERNVPEDVSEINKESCEFMQPKTKSELLSVTTHCDLPTLKDENTEVKDINLFMDVSDIKKESCEFVQSKTEIGLFSLTTHCDLPTLKDESTDQSSHLEQSYTSKQPQRILKPLKYTAPHVSKKLKMRYPCPVCSINCSSLKSRLNHIYGHFGKRSAISFRSSRKKPFRVQFGGYLETCYYCGQCFLNKSQCLFHLFLVHFVKKIIKNCKRKFGDNGHCRCKNCLHAREIHSKEKRFKCAICLKQFNRNSHLSVHLKIHTGEKPFICAVCLKQFTEKGSLTKHLRIHTGEKPFRCVVCSKQFNQKSSLNRHLKIHSGQEPFKCALCLKQFNQSSHLIMHLKIHTGKKPVKCEICSKQFNSKKILNRHLVIHTEKKTVQM